MVDGAGPAWAVSSETTAGGGTVFRDENGDRLVALAVTRAELDVLAGCLAEGPASDIAASLLARLRMLRDELES